MDFDGDREDCDIADRRSLVDRVVEDVCKVQSCSSPTHNASLNDRRGFVSSTRCAGAVLTAPFRIVVQGSFVLQADAQPR